MKKLLALFLAFVICIPWLASCGSDAVIDGYTDKDGAVEFSVSDFELKDGSIGLPFFPSNITGENFADYMGMTLEEFNRRYGFDGESAGMPAVMDGIPCTLGVNLESARGPFIVIGFGGAGDVSREELLAFRENIAGWLSENTVGSGLAYTSPDGRTEITRVVQQIPGDYPEDYELADSDLMIWELTLTYLNEN